MLTSAPGELFKNLKWKDFMIVRVFIALEIVNFDFLKNNFFIKNP